MELHRKKMDNPAKDRIYAEVDAINKKLIKE